MVLFLVAMTVALLAVTHEISESEQEKESREKDIRHVLDQVRQLTKDFPGVTVHGQSVDFGDRARFDTNSHKLSADQARLLRQFAPRILALARDPLGQKWLKQVVVEGFADARGSYLYNLNLSLQRSERVLCVLLAAPAATAGSEPRQRSAAERRSAPTTPSPGATTRTSSSSSPRPRPSPTGCWSSMNLTRCTRPPANLRRA